MALIQTGFGPFPTPFHAAHNDGNLASFFWSTIADALNLRGDWLQPAP